MAEQCNEEDPVTSVLQQPELVQLVLSFVASRAVAAGDFFLDSPLAAFWVWPLLRARLVAGASGPGTSRPPT